MGQKEQSFAYGETKEKLSFHPAPSDLLIMMAEAAGAAVLIAYGFFDSVYGLIAVIPVGLLNAKRYLNKKNEKKEEDIRQEFKEILLSVASAIQTGYSVENAFFEAGAVIRDMYGERSYLAEDLDEMNRQVGMHISVEKAFMEIVKKYPLPEVESFGEIFLYTKRLGGGYAVYLKDTADRIEERITTKSEVNSMVAQKKLELYIMSVMPMAILLYMKLSGGSFLSPLYHNLLGQVLMTVCLGVYAGSLMMGKHMITKVMKSL